MANRSNTYNLVSVFFSRVSATGIPYGQLDPDATETGDTISHALAFIGEATVAGLPTVNYRRATFGGSRFLGSAFMGIDPLESFDIELASSDLTLYNMLKGSNLDTTTIANATITSPNNNAQSPNDISVMFTVAAQERSSGADGDTEYRTYVIPRAQAFIRETGGNVTAGENPQPTTVTITPAMSSKHAWGTAFGSNEGFAGNKTDHLLIQAEYPYALTTWIADGTETTFEVEFVPASSAVTDGKTDNVFSLNGTVTAPSSFNVTTGQVTISAAGSDGDNWAAFYQMALPIRSV